MWRLICVLQLLLQPYLATAQYDLADQIFKQVHESLGAGLNFNNNMFNNFQPFGSDLGQQIFQNVHDSLRGTANLGSQIAENVHRQLAPLQNLGLRIHQQVNKSLMPVRAMSMKNDMKNGVGGTTVATYFGNRPRAFIIKDGVRYSCRGTITGPQCYGYLEPFNINTRQDFCYAPSYATSANRVCLSSGSINVQTYNDQMQCQASDGAPTLFLTRWEYQNLCGNTLPWQIIYKYYPNPGDPRAIPIPNSNPYLNCQNTEPGVCEFEGDQLGSGTGFSSSSGFRSTFNSFQ